MSQTHVFFDFDNTLIDCESLDLIAEKKGVLQDIIEMTNQSMNGDIPLESILEKKMTIIAPSKTETLEAAYECISHITPGTRDVIHLLHTRGIQTHIISSGFHEIIDPIAHILGIPHVHANHLLFHSDGTYKGIDPQSTLQFSDSKPKQIQKRTTEEDTVYMIGDGITDAYCIPVVTQFIGFGGHVIRKNVQQRSDIYITEKNLLAIIPYIE